MDKILKSFIAIAACILVVGLIEISFGLTWSSGAMDGAAIGCGFMAAIMSDSPLMKAKMEQLEKKV